MAALAGAAFGAAGPVAPAHGARAAAATGRVEVTLALRPRHAALLTRLAGASSARSPLPLETVRALFWPTAGQVARVRAAMLADGLALVSRHGLDVTFAGPAPAVSEAFSAPLAESRRANGSRVLRTLARPQVPASIAPLVQDVQGLDTQTLLHPLGRHSAGHTAAPCAGAASTGGYLPSQLGSAGGYGHAALTAGGWDGHGERVAVVALSGYRKSDVAAYQACFGLAVPVTDVPVGDGGSTLSGSDEVELDIETVVSAAPGLDGVDVYMLKPTATMDQAVNAIVAGAPGNGVTVITDSWGVCEPALSPAPGGGDQRRAPAGGRLRHHVPGRVRRFRSVRLRRVPRAGGRRPRRSAVRDRRRRHGAATGCVRSRA